MYEIEIRNRKTGEMRVVIGYDFKEACKAFGYNPEEWKEWCKWYID